MYLAQRLGFLYFLLAALVARSQSQELPFADEIKAFAQQDSAQPPKPGAIVFVGSSSFRLWSGLQNDFPYHRVLNRGFGGAAIPDVMRYADQTIYRYHPAQIIFYCGENDLAASDTVQAATVVQRFIFLFKQVRQHLPGVPFVFVSIKPSPSRAHLLPKITAANESIRQFLAGQKAARFVDIYHPMLQENGYPRGELFGPDSLHMNAKGYAIWKEKLTPALRK